MQSIQDFAKHFIWDARSFLLPLTLAIPAAMIAISLVGYLYKNISVIPKKICEAKDFLHAAFTQKKGESDPEFRKRVLKNIFIGASCTTLFAGMAFACVFCPFLVLPSYLAIPSAIAGICFLGDALVNGKSYCKNIQDKFQSAKEWAKDAFHARKGEPEHEAKRRIAKNIALTVLGVTVAAGVIAGAAYGAYSLIHYALCQNIGPWNVYDILPFQNPVVVFLEYAAIGVAHGALALKNILQGNKAAAAFHLANFAMSFAFPIFYLLDSSPTAPMRLHHSIIGLSLSLLPFKTMKALGTTITLDSALYFFSALRGYEAGYKFIQYDFMNFFLDHMTTYIPALAAMCGAEYAIDRILPKAEKPKEIAAADPAPAPIAAKSSEQAHQARVQKKPETILKQIPAFNSQLFPISNAFFRFGFLLFPMYSISKSLEVA